MQVDNLAFKTEDERKEMFEDMLESVQKKQPKGDHKDAVNGTIKNMISEEKKKCLLYKIDSIGEFKDDQNKLTV